MKRLVAGGFTAALVSALAIVSVPAGADATTHGAPAVKSVSTHGHGARAQARSTAQKLVATPPRYLKATPHDAFRALPVQSSHGLQ